MCNKKRWSFIYFVMKKIMRALKISFVFIGTMVGAGFATGEEIQLYFGKSDVWSLILSSVIAGLFCLLLLTAGRVGCLGEREGKFFNCVFALSGVVTAGIMLSGVRTIGNSPLFAVISLIICLLIGLYGNFGIKVFNVLAVPMIVISVLVISFLNKNTMSGEFRFFGAVGYSAMNVFFESILMYKEGEKADKKEIALASFFVSILIFALVFSMKKACLGLTGTMPFLIVAKTYNLGWLAFGVIILAIYSTVVNCLSVSIAFFKNHMTKTMSVCLVFFATIFISVFPFDVLISNVYPIFSYSGIAFCVYLFAMIIRKKIKKSGKNKSKIIKLRRIKE